MPWIHDVFVSYAHADNAVPHGAAASHGWITMLAYNLNIGPNVRKKDVFIDHGLLPGDAFGDDLVARVESSARLVLVLSQNYLDSAWCGKELEHFMRRYGGNTAEPPDVFVVELCPYEDLRNVPAALASLRKRLFHFKFWYQPYDSAVSLLAGYPTPAASGQDGERRYWRELKNLQAALDRHLRVQQPVSAILPLAATPAMSDIFICYSRKNLVIAQNLRQRLLAQGWSVFMDSNIGAGDRWSEEIQYELAQARAVLTLWSPDAVNSRFVMDEAHEAANRNIIFPAIVEEVPIPYGFRQFQTKKLIGWDGRGEHEEWEQIIQALRKHLDEAHPSKQSDVKPALDAPKAPVEDDTDKPPARHRKPHKKARNTTSA